MNKVIYDIIIVSLIQRYPLLRECLKSIMECDFGDRVVNINVGIVDDYDLRDGLPYPSKRNLLFLNNKKIKLHYFNKNHYPKNFNNIFRECNGDYVIKVDDDIVFGDKEWLIKYENIMNLLNLGIVAMANRRKIIDVINNISLCDTFNGGVMMINRNVIDKIGYFNEEYASFSWEDIDYEMRARACGFDTKYICRYSNNGVKIYHFEIFPDCPSDYNEIVKNKHLNQRINEMKKNTFQLAMKNFEKYNKGTNLYYK